MKKIIIEGKEIRDIQSMCDVFAKAVDAPNGYFGSNLLSFDDCLFGGFGLEAPCEIIWKDSSESRKYLNEKALMDYWEDILEDENSLINGEFFSEEREHVLTLLKQAKQGKLARTLFQDIIEMISSVEERSSFMKQVKLTLK